MNISGRKFRHIKSVMLGLLYGLFATTPAVAEDIEIYTNSISGAQTTANVLFIVDTSGSMTTNVLLSPGNYDPLVDYSLLPGSCFDNNMIYANPNMTGIAGYCSGSRDITDLRRFNATALVCQTGATAIASTGFYTDRVAQFRTGGSKSWRSISRNSSKFNDIVECRADRGVHGNGGAQLYARNSTANGGFGSSSQEINWNWYSTRTLYSGNHLNFLVANPPVNKTRLLVMQEALADVINTSSGINIGLMRFDKHANGGMVVTPMGLIDTTRAAFVADLNYMTASGGTPLSETLYEAALYFQGKDVDYGRTSEAALSSSPYHELMPSHTDSRAPSGGPTYKSPITDECQKNYVVLLTDGAPTSDNGISGSLSRRTAIGMTGGCSGNCLDEIATAIGSKDQSLTVTDDQFVSTFTIGLAIDHPLLSATAQASKNASGQGEYFIASDATSLSDAFTKIVRQVLEAEATFSSPAVSVNAFNRATNLDELYFTLFKPGESEHWAGNFKKFKLDFQPDTADFDGDGDVTELIPVIVDQAGNDAINAATGFFANNSVSFWTAAADAPDGPATAKGGAASRLTASRNLYTVTGAFTNTSGLLVPADGNLASLTNKLAKTNTAVTSTMLNVVGSLPVVGAIPYRDSLLDWAAGIDVRDENMDGSVTDALRIMGDPLHAEPALVQYGKLTSGDPDLVAYVATNDGYLHAFNTDDGSEYFSFVPQKLLPSLDTIFQNTGVNGKQYGLDGNVVPWINDVNRDGDLNDAGDFAYIYFSMRRGGRDIYSMDVTNRNSPQLRWVIEGGSGAFAELGQTWSSINVETILIGGVETEVLIFGGGYDTNQDGLATRGFDSVGRGIYIVNATTGELLWRAGPDAGADLSPAAMQYSIPARIKPLDINGDGAIDRLYTGDMGGQLWRFDIDNDLNTAAGLSVVGGPIADLAVDASINDARRFYYPPDAALIVQEGQAPFVSIVATSGYRAHPLNKDIHDRAYMIRDYNVFDTPDFSSLAPITETELFDTTKNLIGQGSQTQKDAAAITLNGSSNRGWYISLEEPDGTFVGEKGLAEPLILNGVALFTTFSPVSTAVVPGTCKPNDGTGAIYFVNVADGTPTYDLSGTVTKTREDRKVLLDRGGIPPSPTVIITDAGTPTLCVGTECEQAGAIGSLQKMFWYEQ